VKLFARLFNIQALFSLIVVAFCAYLSPAFAQNPTQPGDLSYAVYSNKSAEVFWTRSTDNVAVAAYEVQVNDVVVQTTDATSYYSNTYEGGLEYTVTVTAIDNESNRSEPASVSFIAGEKNPASGDSPATGDSDEQPPTTADLPLAAPTNLRAAIYSRTTFELFWNRVTTDILSYEVLIDSELANKTFGTSSTHRNLMPGTQYSVEVVAIDSDGKRSSAAAINVLMPGKPVVDGGADSGTTDTGMTDSESTDSGLTDSGTTGSGTTDSGTTDTGTTGTGSSDGGTSVSAYVPTDTDIVDVDAFYDEDGYDTVDVIRIDVRTQTTAGVCTIDDQSGCTLDDVKADIDGDDDFKVEIPIKVVGTDLPDDGSQTNATLRQRGGTSRTFPQKSFRVKLDSKEVLWRNERRLQLNKHPAERARIRNKLSFDLMRDLPHLPSLRTQFVNLWIDDGAGPEDYGLFTHVEFVGKEYLVNRQLNDDDRVYKIEFFEFSQGDLDNLQVDENGEPLDQDRFESRLDPKRGDDHRDLVKMLSALVDPEQTFESVFEKHFNKNNVLTWIAANTLLYQTDAVTQNFYLYNPLGTETFYFLPWDYDGTFHAESVLTNSMDNDELAKRLYYGYARGVNSQFISQFYKLPGIHEEIVAVADELRNTYLTDSNISERAIRYSNLIDPYLTRSPDSDHNPRYDINSTKDYAGFVASNHEALRTKFDIPMPHTMQDAVVLDGTVNFSWTPAFDVTRTNTLSYDLQVANSIDFNTESIRLNVEGIEDDEELITHSVNASLLPRGTLYYRVIARGDSNPIDVWQISENTIDQDGQTWLGVVKFDLP